MNFVLQNFLIFSKTFQFFVGEEKEPHFIA